MQSYKRGVGLQRSSSFLDLPSTSSTTNVIGNQVIDRDIAQRHNPTFATSSWPPELPQSYSNKAAFRLPGIKHEKGNKRKQTRQMTKKSTNTELGKDFHSIAQTAMQDNKWKRVGKVAVTAMGYGALHVYDKCKAIVGRVYDKCNIAFNGVRQRFRRGDRDRQ